MELTAHWFIEDEIYPGAWKPLWKCDSDRLEEAFRSGEVAQEVPIYCTRAVVNLESRLSLTTYYDSPPRQVRRCTWFYKDKKGNFVPYAEDLANELEAWVQQVLVERQEEREPSKPKHEFQVQRTFESQSVTFVAQHINCKGKGLNQWGQSQPVIGDLLVYEYTNWTASIQLPTALSVGSLPIPTLPDVGTSTQVRRGYEHATPVDDEEQAEYEVGHLLLAVHGIGEFLFSRADSPLPGPPFKGAIRDFRQLIIQNQKKLQELARSAGNEDFANRPIRRVEVLPIEWFDAVHGPDNEFTRRLALVTLPSVTAIRSFGNEALSDLMMYCDTTHQQTILDTVTRRFNQVYQRYMELNPNFSGRVSIVGHSLGSIISFDILANQPSYTPETSLNELGTSQAPTARVLQLSATVERLVFQPQAYFACGSPIALFLALRGTDVSDFHMPTCPRMYNLFKPHDPVAYRIEPLQDESLASAAPAVVPHSVEAYRPLLETPGKNSWTSMMKKVAGITEARLGLLASEARSNPKVALNAGARLDWAFPAGTFENEYISATSAHTGYFADVDVALFMATHLQVWDDVNPLATDVDGTGSA